MINISLVVSFVDFNDTKMMINMVKNIVKKSSDIIIVVIIISKKSKISKVIENVVHLKHCNVHLLSATYYNNIYFIHFF